MKGQAMITVTHKIDVDGHHYAITHIPDFRHYRYGDSTYAIGWSKPNYPVPAIPLRIVYPHEGYADMIYIDDVTDPDDPIMVCAWDFWQGANCIGKRGE